MTTATIVTVVFVLAVVGGVIYSFFHGGNSGTGARGTTRK